MGDFVYDIEKYPSGASDIEGAVDKILSGQLSGISSGNNLIQ